MMRIAICGSMFFAREMLKLKEQLEAQGHETEVPASIEIYQNDERIGEDKWDKIKFDVIKTYFEKIKNSDAVLIANLSKNNIENYIGGNSLIEMAFAHVLDKKIFLLNPIPKMNYSNEIEVMGPIILNSDLSRINEL